MKKHNACIARSGIQYYLLSELPNLQLKEIPREYRDLKVFAVYRPSFVLEDAKVDRKEYTHFLEAEMTKACDNQFKEIAEGKLDAYETLFQQPLKWYRKIEQRLKKIEIKGSGV